MLTTEAGPVQTDDRGEYRITGLAPARYFVRADSFASTVTALIRERLGRPSASSGVDSTVYYPGVTDADGASPVDVREVEEIRSINFVLFRQQTYRIRGHLVDANGKPPVRPMLGVLPLHIDSFWGSSMSISPYCGDSPECKNPTGEFELKDLAPGSYWVRAQLPVPSTPELQGMMQTPGADPLLLPQPQSAMAIVQVQYSDVDDVDLKFYPNISIAGRVSIDDALPAASSTAIKFGFRQIIAGFQGPLRAAVLDAQGRFSVSNLLPGEYQLEVTDLPAGMFLAEARAGDINVLRENIRILSPQSEPLNIKLSAKSGSVEGTVIDSKSNAVSKASLVLIPDVKGRSDFYKTTIADEAGHFAITGVAPGDYSAFSWEDIEDYSYFDPEVVRQYEAKGTPVHVVEASKEVLKVTRIPATQ